MTGLAGRPRPEPAAVDAELVGSVVEQVWESLLHVPVLTWAGGETPSAPGVDDDVVLRAEVSLSGDWDGAVRLELSRPAAAWIAATMLGDAQRVDLPEVDVRDAVGEMANVLGGNLKSALASRTAMGLPAVTEIPPAPHTPVLDPVPDPVTTIAERWVFDVAGRPVAVEVLTHRETATLADPTG